MSDFAALKRNRGTSLETLTKKVEEMQRSSYQRDERYWVPTPDKAGNASAVIRFLPAPPQEDMPFVRYFEHKFKGPTGRWYVERSRTNLGANERDPVGEFNQKLWDKGETDDSPERKQASRQKRNLNYVSNILVLEDKNAPENEGKVFLYRYGKKIFDKANEVMHPPSERIKPINPFDFWDGADFNLIVKKQGDFPNYDASKFLPQAPLSEDEDYLERIWRQEYSLAAEVDPSKIKSYDELEKIFRSVMGDALKANLAKEEPRQQAPRQGRVRETSPEEDDSALNRIRTGRDAPPPRDDGDEDEELARFRKLMAEDDEEIPF